LRSSVVSRGAKKTAPRRVENDIENVFRNVNTEYLQGQILPPPVPVITPHKIHLDQCGGCRLPVSDQYICHVYKDQIYIFVDYQLVEGVITRKSNVNHVKERYNESRNKTLKKRRP